ncbi:uncharacterized protein LOC119769299 [Culex quinquefasciatus]|uniref:uncharacterized protein LOC119769299 n=1 Tax=Culex quinquefasciatus TaxID=7176 RepID=UPI0018E37889|nr:uncharacterized protein LOC119769299 [Culex quinquefasciatus]
MTPRQLSTQQTVYPYPPNLSWPAFHPNQLTVPSVYQYMPQYSRMPEYSNIQQSTMNVGGINTTIANYALAISSASYDLYAITETWLTSATLSSQIFGPEYEVFRGDRTASNSCKGSGGGVLLAVRSNLKPRQLFPPDCTVPEQVWVAVPLAASTMFVCVIYIPPKFDNEKPLFDQHRHSLTWIVSKMKANDSLMVLGDFNFPAIRWTRTPTDKLIPNLALTPTNELKHKLLDEYSTANLSQLNDMCNNSSNVLDLCFASSGTPINFTLLPAPLPLVKDVRHHFPFLVSISCTTLDFRDVAGNTFMDYRKGNYDGMNNFLTNINWNQLLANLDADTAADTWTGVLTEAINTFVPRKQRQPPRHPPWSTPRLQILKSRKRAALKKYAKHPTDRWRNHYRSRNRKYSILNKQLFRRHQHRIQSRLKRDPKKFWNHVNEQRKETGLPTAMILDGEEATSTESISDLFRRQFSSVFTNEAVGETHIAKAASNVPLRPPIDLTRWSLPSPSVVPAPLSKVLPAAAQTASPLSKLFEVIVLDFIKFNCCDYVALEQHGFMAKRSTNSNLVSYSSFILRTMQQRKQIDAIYTDLSAAFDKLNHRIAVAKLERLGIPQGSHLGPLIFLLYMNDVHHLLGCHKLSYADDIKLFTVVENDTDCQFLQEQLDLFANWCSENRMNAIQRVEFNLCSDLFDFDISRDTIKKRFLNHLKSHP